MAITKESRRDYYIWLLHKIGVSRVRKSEYLALMKQLHSIDYEYKITNDINRKSDGLILRDIFEKETGEDLSGGYPCSVLEVMIGVSRRLAEDVIGDPNHEGLTERIFWEMVSNLGLLKYRGNGYDKGESCVKIMRWIGRNFKENGEGSPFPLKHPKDDQRKVEMWSQVMWYLAEHPELEEAQ